MRIVELAKQPGLKDVYIHACWTAATYPPPPARIMCRSAADKLQEIGVGKIATVMGRYYAMDRDNRWDRVEKAYAAMVYGEGVQAQCPVEAVADSLRQGGDRRVCGACRVRRRRSIGAGDSVVFFNFRPDRAREITRTLVDPAFEGFERKKGFFPLTYVCMTQYDATMPNVRWPLSRNL